MIYIPILIIPFAISLAADRFYKKQVTPLYIVSISFISFVITWILYKFFIGPVYTKEWIAINTADINNLKVEDLNLGFLNHIGPLYNFIDSIINSIKEASVTVGSQIEEVNKAINDIIPKIVMFLSLIINSIISMFGLIAIGTYKRCSYKQIVIIQLVGFLSTILILYLIFIS